MRASAAWVFTGLILAGGSAVGQEGLPSVVAALSSGRFETELRTLAASGRRMGGFLLPPLPVKPGEQPAWDAVLGVIPLIDELFPAAEEVWMRLALSAPAPGTSAAEIERQVRLLTEDAAGRLVPPFAGLILEPDPAVPDELVKLLVTSLSVALKTGGKAVEIAVPCPVADRLGMAAAAHVDRFTVDTESAASLPALRHLADLKILRPTLWIGGGNDVRAGGAVYLENLLAAVKFRADKFALGPGSPEKVIEALSVWEYLKTKIPESLSILVDDVPLFRLEDRSGGRPAQAVFMDESFETIIILAKIDPSSPDASPWRFISGTGETYAAAGFDPLSPAVSSAGAPLGTANILWDKNYILLQAKRAATTDLRFRDAVDVKARMDLSVSEIIARWQRYDARQRRRLRHYLAAARMDMHFQPPGLGSGFDVALHFRYFWKSDGSQFWEQTAQYLNGIKLSMKRTFPLPMLEPDKVVVRPLEMKLVDSYVYTLEGRETVGGSECYVLSFKPRPGARELLFSGRIWIDRATFRRARVLLVQDQSSGSIIGQTELQTFGIVEGTGGDQWDVLLGSDIRQKMLAAGREFLLERQYRFSDFAFNGKDYDAALENAFRGDRPMLSDTASGLRELVKDQSGQRQVREKPGTLVWSLILGLIYDGTFGFPIPLAGVSAIDGDFLHSGGQLSTFWAGPILALNYTKKNKSALTWGGDLFLSALPRRDRVIRGGADVPDEEIYYFSEGLGARLRWQPSVWMSATATGYLIYEHHLRTKTTSDAYVLPRNGFTLNPNLGLTLTSGGYEANAEISWYDRLGWRSWGMAENAEIASPTYTRAYGRIAKQFYLGSFTRFGADLAFYTGWDLDRFACYQPSVFSTPKIRGIPSGTVSLDKVASLGLNLGFTVFDLIRIDGFYSFARCFEHGTDGRRFDFQGLEFDFGTIGPWRSYIQGIVSFSVRGLPADYKSRWSVYLLMFIPFD